MPTALRIEALQPSRAAVASVNGVALHAPGEPLAPDELRRRACTELLRQQAQRLGLLAADDAATPDGVVSDTAAAAIESLLAREITLPEPGDDACRRHFAAHAARYRRGERVRVRHVLFAVTPGVDVRALREHAERCLLELRAADSASGAFARAAAELSNCPSAAQGGELGWLANEDCAPEFARELFGRAEVGVLPRLVHTRFGLHVVEVLAREAGVLPGYDAVRGAVAAALRQQAFATALRQYLRLLAGAAVLESVDLDGAATPLVQ